MIRSDRLCVGEGSWMGFGFDHLFGRAAYPPQSHGMRLVRTQDAWSALPARSRGPAADEAMARAARTGNQNERYKRLSLMLLGCFP
jgi:hypothetical protein